MRLHGWCSPFAWLFVAALSGCGSPQTMVAPRDLSVADKSRVIDLTFVSDCGKPGDVGNSLGVGKFCSKLTDCEGNGKAVLCTILGDDRNFYCTFACKPSDAGDECGENAHCACSTGGCGCFPDRCN